MRNLVVGGCVFLCYCRKGFIVVPWFRLFAASGVLDYVAVLPFRPLLLLLVLGAAALLRARAVYTLAGNFTGTVGSSASWIALQ